MECSERKCKPLLGIGDSCAKYLHLQFLCAVYYDTAVDSEVPNKIQIHLDFLAHFYLFRNFRAPLTHLKFISRDKISQDYHFFFTFFKNLFYTKQSHNLTHLFFIHLLLSSLCEASTGFISVANWERGDGFSYNYTEN